MGVHERALRQSRGLGVVLTKTRTMGGKGFCTTMLALLVVTAATVISGELADEITESSLNDALARFREDVSVGLVSPKALPGPAANGTDVWQPPLQSLIAKQQDGYLADPTTQTLLVLYEVLQNQTFYNLTDLSNVMAYIAGVPEFDGDFQLEVLRTGLPPLADLVVRTWQTDMVVDVFQDIKGKLKSNLGLFEGLFEEISAANVTESNKRSAVVELLVHLMIELIRDPAAVFWQDLAAVLGEPLGPALIPILESPMIQEVLQDRQGVVQRALEKEEEIIAALEVLAGKIIVYNPYFPSPCLANSSFCPEAFDDTEEGNELQDLFERAQAGDDSIDFTKVKESFLDLFLSEFGLKNMLDLLEQAVNSPSTSSILSTLAEWGNVSATEPSFLGNLSIGAMELDTKEAAGVPLEPLACLANISALMYESPKTKAGWAQGLGLRLVGETETSGFLSSLASVYLTKSAVVVAYEGTPYLQADFFRGLYGWLQDLLSAEEVPFEYPCDASDDKDLCNGLAEAFPDARVYKGFMPKQNSSDEVQALIDQALEEWKAQAGPESPSKPSIYFTGHSLGGPTNLDSMDSTAYMFINQYDFVPYLPPMENATHGEHTLFFDHQAQLGGTLKTIDTADTAYAPRPRNVFMPPLGFHSMEAQYLPLSRSLSGAQGLNCTFCCDVGQCGLFECPDSCDGL